MRILSSNIWSLIILAIAVSVDGFSVGITYGLKGIKIGLLPLLIISGISTAAIYVTVSLGLVVSEVLGERFASWLGGSLLIIIGLWLIYSTVFNTNTETSFDSNCYSTEDIVEADGEKSKLEKQREKEIVFSFCFNSIGIIIRILKQPVKADFDQSGSISYWEAVILGFALALDALGAGLGAGLAGMAALFFPVLIGISKFIFVSTGVLAGRKVGNFLPTHFKVYPGLVIVILGIITIL